MLMQKKPADSELEILQLLWQHGSCSVRDVHTALSERRPVVYTTTLKTMQIIEHHHTARIHSPMVVGVVKQVTLLPLGLVNSIEPEQLESILAHELAHIKRHDHLFNLLQSVAETLFFFNPFVWWVGARIRVEREHACDDIALQYTNAPAVYARPLANVEAWRSGQYRLAMAFVGSQGTILQRVRRVLGQPGRQPLPIKAFWSKILLSLLLGFVLVAPHLQADTSLDGPLEPELEPKTETPCSLPCPEEQPSARVAVVSTTPSPPAPPSTASRFLTEPARDTVPVPEPKDSTAEQLRAYTQGLEHQLRQKELQWRAQKALIEQEMHQKAAALQEKMRAQEQAVRQFHAETEKAQQQLQQQEQELQLQELELEQEELELQKMEEKLQQLQSQGQSDEYIRQLEKTQAAQRALAKAENALEQQEMELEQQARTLEIQLQAKQQTLQREQLEKQQKMQQLTATYENRMQQLQQQVELKRAKMELKLEKARTRYEQLLQKREAMKKEGQQMRERQQRSSEGGQ